MGRHTAMGCTNSKIDVEDSVARCKSRMRFVEQAVSHRHAFAAAHAAYIQSLRISGAAIRQFADNEPPQQAKQPAFTPREQLHPPPKPPVPEGPLRPLIRAHTLPPIALSSTEITSERSTSSRRSIKTVQEDQEYFGDDSQRHSLPREREIPFSEHPSLGDSMSYVFGEHYNDSILAAKPLEVEHEGALEEDFEQKEEQPAVGNSVEMASASKPTRGEENPEPAVSEKENENALQVIPRSKIGKQDLGIVLGFIDDQFMESYEAGKKVSRLLEVRRSHYHHMSHGDFDSGMQSHRAEVSRILTWGKPSSRIPVAKEGVNANPLKDGHEGHASTLDRLLAWEKKLYDEVKAGEAIRLELEKRYAQLKSQKERGEDAVKIDKTKALLKSLQTRYIVECQAVDSAILEVQKLRDEQLYPQLVKLIQGLKEMWTSMCACHQKQLQMVDDLMALEMISSLDETSKFHRTITEELSKEITNWQQSLRNLIKTQKDYPVALHEWLHLNVIPIESDVKDKQAAPQHLHRPPVYLLCKAWIEALKDISGMNVMKDLEKFSDILLNMLTKQEEELRQKNKYETLEREYERKKSSLETFEKKYGNKHMEMHAAQENEELITRNPVQERKSNVDLLQRRVDEEKEDHAKLCQQNSTMILKGLQEGLPGVLRSVRTFSDENAKAYTRLYITSI